MSVQTHLHLSQGLLRHLDLLRHLESLAELLKKGAVKVNLRLLGDSFVSSARWILIIGCICVLHLGIDISIATITSPSTNQINLGVSLNSRGSWYDTHQACLPLYGLKSFYILSTIGGYSTHIVALWLLSMRGGPWSTETLSLLLSISNLNLATVHDGILATCANGRLCATLAALRILHLKSIRCQLVLLVVHLLFCNFLCALLVRV